MHPRCSPLHLRRLAAAALALSTIRCAAPAGDGQPAGHGVLRLETSVSGVRYRLTAARLGIDGPMAAEVEPDAMAPLVSFALRPGDYAATLRDGWCLERDSELGYQPTPAKLISDNPVRFHVRAATTTFVPYTFETSCTIVDFAEADLDLCIGCGNDALRCR